jgi:uncharacterized protein (UPF0332 family)
MKPETRALLDKAQQSIQAAINLQRDNFLDFAASRAYYAMFYTAEALLIEQNLSFSSHAAVISAFGQFFAKTNVLDPRFHRYLLDAQDMRNVGDYGIGPGVTSDQASTLIKWSNDFLQAAENLLKSGT